MRNAIEAAFKEKLAPSQYKGIDFLYPNGCISACDYAADVDTWAWGFGDFEYGLVDGLDKTINSIVNMIEKDGPLTGIIGFSTGAAITAIIVSLLECHNYASSLRLDVGGTYRQT